MRDLAILTFITLDGVMQAPSMPQEDISGSFQHGGWAAPYWEGVMAQVEREAMAQPYDMLFGRKTYDMFAGHWPDVKDSPAANRMNAARKYVVSSTLQSPTWTNTQIIAKDVVDQVRELKQQDGPLLQIHGSWQLIQLLMEHQLIDEYRLWTFPVIVGAGKRLMEPGNGQVALTLMKTAAAGNGVTMSIYRKADD